MIISRAPVRISLGGGGTDLPSHYRTQGGGFVVSGAISRHIYVAVNWHFEDDIFLKYSALERVADIDAIRHPLLREALRLTGVDRKVEISSMADVPANTGLGTSASFTVGVLKALHALRRDVVSNRDIAEEACHIEMDVLGEPVGKQDQFIAAIGGVTAFEFHPDDGVTVVPVPMADETRNHLEDHLLLFFTGIRRSASEVLVEQDQRSKGNDRAVSDNLNEVTRIGRDSFEALRMGNMQWFAALMTEQWELKRARTPTATTGDIDRWISHGLEAGAWGGKLVGAGGGGFLLFYTEDQAALRAAMGELGLEEFRFTFDYEGAKLLVVE
jgi:D-glycero-alpha-D-manno-heptose-7-phosphate kinase